MHGMDVFHIHWLSWSLWLLSATGLIWVAILIPIQMRQARMAQEFAVSGAIPTEYWRLGRLWAIWGFILTLLPFGLLFFIHEAPRTGAERINWSAFRAFRRIPVLGVAGVGFIIFLVVVGANQLVNPMLASKSIAYPPWSEKALVPRLGSFG